jgi:uncharacterized protein
MSDLPPMLAQLDEILFALGDEVMPLEQLDGFFAGLLVCPDLIMPGEWLAAIWNRRPDARGPLADSDLFQRLFTLLHYHYNTLVMSLVQQPQDYAPLLSEDAGSGDVRWESWIEGFVRAMALRPDAWQLLLDADATTAAAMRGMMGLVEVVYSKDVPEHVLAALQDSAPDDIARWVVTLHAWRLANGPLPGLLERAPPAAPPFSAARTGRNDPCPCGSGRKYKKCCGLN